MTEAEQERKPCPACLNVAVTWSNVDDYWLCGKHMQEMFKRFRIDAISRGDHLKGE